MLSHRMTLRAGLASACLVFSIAAQTPALEVRNRAGVRLAIDMTDSNPALLITVPGAPQDKPGSKILFPEHVTVRAHGQSEQQHLYIFRPGLRDNPPRWKKNAKGFEYETDFGEIHFIARATLAEDGILFRYEFVNHSAIEYDMATAVTDPRFDSVFFDPRLERTYVHHKDGFDLLASETPARLTTPLKAWFPVRYLASFTVPVPEERIQQRDGIAHYYKSRTVDTPMIATVSEDRTWVAASFARAPGNVWSNPELTCQHVDPEIPLPKAASATDEVKILVLKGSLDDALRKAEAQRRTLK